MLNAPQIVDPFDDCMTSVPVDKIVTGAQVDIYVNQSWRGSATIGASSGAVAISGRLRVKDLVSARQRLCAATSDPSKLVTVSFSQRRENDR